VSITLYNTLTKRIEPLEPLDRYIVKAYFCGPTVYDHTHLGHIRAYLAFDFIKRYIISKGYSFIHVQNITDIDDKIIKRSQDEGTTWNTIAEHYTREYLEVLKALNINVDIHPTVSSHINEIIEFVQKLVDKGYAYVAPSGSVYFDLSVVDDYGKLSGRILSNEWRQEEEYLYEKKHPYDFALWKVSKPGEPWWESPWGRGRPGWHTECAVMSSRYLGPQFDIHGGGQDLVFPHHENEIAMAEAAFGIKPWVRYWIHVGYLTIRGEKMSKSLGNIIYAKEAIDKWGTEVLRLWTFSAHYRKQIEFNEDALNQHREVYKRLVVATESLKKIIRSSNASHKLSDSEINVLRLLEEINMQFHESMSNDFNTPKAMEALNNLITTVFRDIEPKENQALALRAYSILYSIDKVVGVLDKYLGEKIELDIQLVEKLVDLILRIRTELRKRKDYEISDRIREELLKLGIRVFDYKEGSKWVFEK